MKNGENKFLNFKNKIKKFPHFFLPVTIIRIKATISIVISSPASIVYEEIV